MPARGLGFRAAHQVRAAPSPAPVGCPGPGAAGGSPSWGRYRGGPALSGWPPPASCSRRSWGRPGQLWQSGSPPWHSVPARGLWGDPAGHQAPVAEGVRDAPAQLSQHPGILTLSLLLRPERKGTRSRSYSMLVAGLRVAAGIPFSCSRVLPLQQASFATLAWWGSVLLESPGFASDFTGVHPPPCPPSFPLPCPCSSTPRPQHRGTHSRALARSWIFCQHLASYWGIWLPWWPHQTLVISMIVSLKGEVPPPRDCSLNASSEPPGVGGLLKDPTIHVLEK